MLTRPLIFIASPLRAPTPEGVVRNVKFAENICEMLARTAHVIPFAPHVYCPRFLDDTKEEQRAIGLDISMNFLAISAAAYFLLPEGHSIMSEGMRGEWEKAGALGIPRDMVKAHSLVAIFDFIRSIADQFPLKG